MSPPHPSHSHRDHPRSRGVYSIIWFYIDITLGSSPLARGLLLVTFHSHDSVGIIPARAGFTFPPAVPSSDSGDHPRSRGVYCLYASRTDLRSGSSPLARGLPLGIGDGVYNGRIIPARAGFTFQVILSATEREDHPRSRGVYSPAWNPPSGVRGSSPLARGLLQPERGAPRIRRIIPARAGFTFMIPLCCD